MFTGIIQAIGTLGAAEPRGGDLRLAFKTGALPLDGVAVGDSIAVDGVCLTAVALDSGGFAADVSRETLDLTTLGRLTPGSPVNLEKALALGQPLGGHLVSGHVDGLGQLRERQDDGRSLRLVFELPRELARYIARKGSVTVNGVSLTVNEVEGARFGVNLVPHTQQATNLGALAPGAAVNIEVDLLARYLERLMQGEKT